MQAKGDHGRIVQKKSQETLFDKIQQLKNGINSGRSFSHGSESVISDIRITNYWLLGFIEGEGSFSVTSEKFRVRFGLGSTFLRKTFITKNHLFFRIFTWL